jgi:hypothetical protein
MTGAMKSVTTCWPGVSSASAASANRLRPETVGVLTILPAAAMRWVTRRVPPAANRCEARKRPPGFRSQMTGASTQAWWQSSTPNSTPASMAMAVRCMTALVEPPEAETATAAFRRLARVMYLRAVSPAKTRSTISRPQRSPSAALPGSTAGTSLAPIGDRPMTDRAMAMVLAVNWPPQAPAPGQTAVSTAFRPASSRAPAAWAPMASKISWTETSFVPMARHDGAAVVDQARDIHAGQGHGGGRDGLVAADDADDAVQLVALDRQLDASRRRPRG